MAEDRPFLSVIIPAHDEEPRIGATLRKIIACLEASGHTYEIIVVDDGSGDRTLEISKTLAAEHPPLRVLENRVNEGKGFSVRKAILQSRGECVLFTDVDLSTPIEEFDKLLHWLRGGFDIAIGSRRLKESDIRLRQPWYRECMGKVFSLLVQLIALRGISDTQCGFKCFKRQAALAAFSKSRFAGFCFDVEVLWIARRSGHRIKEVPVVWYNENDSHVDIMDAAAMFIDLLRLRLNAWQGKYDV